MPQVIVQPFDAATNKAISIINQKDPSLLKNVEKVIVHSSGGPELGHVAMGPGKNPREIHIFKNRIRDIVMRNANATAKKTLTPQELEQALVDGILETIAHESFHIGPTRTPEQIAKEPFKGEGEAERGASEFMKKVHPANCSFKLSKRAAQLEMACPHCLNDVSNLTPEKTSAGLYKMLTCPHCKAGFYPQDAMMAVKKKPEKPEWNMPEKGWWGIFIFDWGYGFVDSEAKANLIKDRIAKMFIENGIDKIEDVLPDLVFGLHEYPRDIIMQVVARTILGPEPKMTNRPYENQKEVVEYDRLSSEAYKESNNDVNSILNGSGDFQKKKRREIIDGVIGIHKVPSDYKPPKEAIVSGGFPTSENFINANDEVINDLDLNKIRAANAKKSRRHLEKEFEGIINTTIKKLRLKEQGIDPSKMCDDAQSKKKVDEVIAFNRNILGQSPKTCGLISKLIKKFGDYELINSLAAWQFKNSLKLTGKLDDVTVKKLAISFSAPKSLPRNFAPVVPGLLYRGGLISDESQLQALKDLGIQRVVSLHSNPDVPRLCNKMGVEHISAPIENGSPEDLGRKVFGNSVSSFLTEKPTYVHCFFGEDRTGGVIARFRTETGWPCDLAYREAKHYGFKDIFVDLIDWFSEFCDKKPVNTDKIRKALKDAKPYQNPEIFPMKEQDCSLPTPAPDDVPFQDMEPTSFPSYKNYITSPIPTSISTVPLSIRSSIKIKAQEKVEEDAENVEEDSEESEANDIDPAANIVGLQESEIEQNMNQSYTLEPFFSNIGNLG